MNPIIIALACVCILVGILLGVKILKFLIHAIFFLLCIGIGLSCTGFSLAFQMGMYSEWLSQHPIALTATPCVGLIALLIACVLGKNSLFRLFVLIPVALCIWHIYKVFTPVTDS